jgi:hypothetical protein
MKYFSAIIIIIHLSMFNLHGQVKFVNEFLNIGVGARAHGMSGSVVASANDATAAYWNPANLTSITKPMQLNAMHANWFGGIANYDFASIAFKMKGGKSFGSLSLIRMGIDNLPNTLNLIGPDNSINFDRITTFSAADYAVFLSMATKKTENLDIGGSLKVIHRTIGSFGNAWGFGADFGIRYKLGKFVLAAQGRDITTTFNSWRFNLNEDQKDRFLATGNDVPISSTETTLPRVITGIAFHESFASFSLLVEANIHLSTDGRSSGIVATKNFIAEPLLGLELGVSDKVYIRGGLGNIQRIINISSNNKVIDFQPNVGLGLVLGRLKIDYALANVGNVSGVLTSHIFSLALDFKEREQ